MTLNSSTTSFCHVKYIGLPRHLRRLIRADTQFIVDKIASRATGWNGRLIHRAGWLELVNAIIIPCLVYFLAIFIPFKWLILRINKYIRAFLWKGVEECNGGHCLINWYTICRHKTLGDLGIKDVACLA